MTGTIHTENMDRFVRQVLASQLVEKERDDAIKKHGYQNTPAWPFMSDKDRLVILIEEVGEVARAMTYDEGDRNKLIAELVQVSTMALMWTEGLINAKTQQA